MKMLMELHTWEPALSEVAGTAIGAVRTAGLTDSPGKAIEAALADLQAMTRFVKKLNPSTYCYIPQNAGPVVTFMYLYGVFN